MRTSPTVGRIHPVIFLAANQSSDHSTHCKCPLFNEYYYSIPLAILLDIIIHIIYTKGRRADKELCAVLPDEH